MRSAIPVLAVFALAGAGCSGLVEHGPTVVVTTSYPGANAQIVADTVAVPIEQQIYGVESMVRLESESRNDGSYTAYVRFKVNADPKIAVTLVQNRVAVAKLVLPEAVQHVDVAVRTSAAESSENRVTIALVDHGDQGRDALRQFSEACLKRIAADGAIVNAEVFPGPDGEQTSVQVDRARCKKHGVSLTEVFTAIEAAGADKKIDELSRLQVRSTNGDAISLGALATFGLVSGTTGVYRVDLYPAMRITGSPPEGKIADSAASRCVELADAERRNQNYPDDFAVVSLTTR